MTITGKRLWWWFDKSNLLLQKQQVHRVTPKCHKGVLAQSNFPRVETYSPWLFMYFALLLTFWRQLHCTFFDLYNLKGNISRRTQGIFLDGLLDKNGNIVVPVVF